MVYLPPSCRDYKNIQIWKTGRERDSPNGIGFFIKMAAASLHKSACQTKSYHLNNSNISKKTVSCEVLINNLTEIIHM